MAERLANHFACYRPASDLFLQLLDMDKLEDAKFMLAVSARVLCPASDSDTRGQMSSVLISLRSWMDSFRKDVKSEQTPSEPPRPLSDPSNPPPELSHVPVFYFLWPLLINFVSSAPSSPLFE